MSSRTHAVGKNRFLVMTDDCFGDKAYPVIRCEAKRTYGIPDTVFGREDVLR